MKSPGVFSELSKNVFPFLLLELEPNTCRSVGGPDIDASGMKEGLWLMGKEQL